MFITANQLVLHAIGDYVLQSDWMAQRKTENGFACFVHVILYTVPFLLLTQSPAAMIAIAWTHFVIDHYRLARYVCWVKNFIRPGFSNDPWSSCSDTGYCKDRPAWLSVWLLIITDNIMHVICNAAAIRWL